VDRLPTTTVMVDVPDPGAAMEVGLKLTVWPLPCPEADNVIAELKLPEIVVVIFELPDEPLDTEIDVGEAETVNPDETPEVTISETVVDSTSPPPVPVTVME
jgi:hypothetical protein